MPSFLEDCHAIEQVYIRYCEIIDTKTFDRMDEVFTPDTYGDYSNSLPGVYVEGLAPLIQSMHHNLGEGSLCGPTHHNVTNFRIKVDGDKATTKVQYYAVHLGLKKYEGKIYSMWGQYNDEMVRTPAGWRVKR